MKRFEGKEVLSSGIEIPNAAGGLRAALRIHPQEFHHGERRWVVLEVVVGKVRFDPVPKTSGLERVHVFAAEAATSRRRRSRRPRRPSAWRPRRPPACSSSPACGSQRPAGEGVRSLPSTTSTGRAEPSLGPGPVWPPSLTRRRWSTRW